jgi:hypothetical protein
VGAIMEKTLEERVDDIEWELDQIKKIFAIQLDQSKLDQEVHQTMHDCLILISKRLGVEVEEPVQ